MSQNDDFIAGKETEYSHNIRTELNPAFPYVVSISKLLEIFSGTISSSSISFKTQVTFLAHLLDRESRNSVTGHFPSAVL